MMSLPNCPSLKKNIGKKRKEKKKGGDHYP